MRCRQLLTALVVLLASSAFAEDPGERYALLIGVSEYRNDSDLTRLKYPESDMTLLAGALVDVGFKPENVRLMVQRDITDARFNTRGGGGDQFKPRLSNISTELKLFVQNKRRSDTVVVAFAGHGIQLRGKEEAYYCPADAKASDMTTLLDLNSVFELLKDCGAGRKLLVADCCRNDPIEASRRSGYTGKVESASRMQRIKPPESVAALYSCRGGESAFEEDDLKGGVFTHFLARGLRGEAAKNGVVEVGALAGYVQYNVFEYIRKAHSTAQTPVCSMNSDGLMILGHVEPSALPLENAAGAFNVPIDGTWKQFYKNPQGEWNPLTWCTVSTGLTTTMRTVEFALYPRELVPPRSMRKIVVTEKEWRFESDLGGGRSVAVELKKLDDNTYEGVAKEEGLTTTAQRFERILPANMAAELDALIGRLNGEILVSTMMMVKHQKEAEQWRAQKNEPYAAQSDQAQSDEKSRQAMLKLMLKKAEEMRARVGK